MGKEAPSKQVPTQGENGFYRKPLLPAIVRPSDIKKLPEEELPNLASEVRKRMVDIVSQTGGHLASSLGTVELAIALCRVFDFPRDKVVWDVGHQAYAWKILASRNAVMPTLRTFGGVRGFPWVEESPYDSFVGGHAGVALSATLGMAAARDARASSENIIAVVGDASLTNGISLEALNAIRHTTQRFILIVNDNGMSISRNVGAFARFLARCLAGLRYNRIRAKLEETGRSLRLNTSRRIYWSIKSAIKSILLRHHATIFEDLGLRYIGPIDGHDIPALENAFRIASESRVPIVLHVATIKGRGFHKAECNPTKWHGVDPWQSATNKVQKESHRTWSEAFGCALMEHSSDSRVVAITAAMRDGTGLTDWFHRFPSRSYDVGICEEHALVFAAGLAISGLRPVVALYSTFAQRAVDNIMHDVCLQDLPVVLCLDRAGVVGSDGPTHHGLYDLAMLRALPGLTIEAPASEEGLKTALSHALDRQGPTVIRYPKGTLPASLPTFKQSKQNPVAHMWLLGNTAMWIRDALADLPIALHVVEHVKPLPLEIASLPDVPFITLEDASATGGFGSAVAEVHRGPLLILGWPDEFIPQGTVQELREAFKLDADSIRQRILSFLESTTSKT